MRTRVCLAVAAVLGLAMSALVFAADNQPQTDRSGQATMDRHDAGTTGTLTRKELILHTSKLHNLNAYNSQNENLGEIQDLIIDVHNGQVMYGVLDTGIGGKLIPVPWNALRLMKWSDGDFAFLLNVNKDRLANAPTVSSDADKTDFTDQKWQQTVSNFFGVRTVAKPAQETDQPKPMHEHQH